MSIDTSAWFSEENERIMESFLRGSPLENSLIAGVFYAGSESDEAKKYNGAISYFFEKLASLYYNALPWLGIWDKEERKKMISELKNKINEVSKEFIKFLKGDLEEWKEAQLKEKVKTKVKKEENSLISQEKAFKIYYVRKGNSGKGDFSMYYIDEDFQKEVLEIIEEIHNYEDEVQAYNETRKKLNSISLKATRTLLEGLLNVAPDPEVKSFFEFLINLVSLEKDDMRDALLPRFLKLRVDPYFAFPEVENSEEGFDSVGYITYKPLIVWLGYFPSPLSENEVLERIGRKIFTDWLKRYEKNSEEALNLVREELSLLQELLGSDPNHWISKLYGEESEEFLRKVRETLHLILEGKVRTVGSVAFVRNGEPRDEAGREYYLKGDKKRVLLFISDLKYEEISGGINRFSQVLKNGSSYLHTKGKIDKYHRFIYFNSLFPDWDFLKEKEKEINKKHEWGEKFLAFLLQLGAWTKALIKYGEDKGIEFIPIFLLNVGGEEDRNGGELLIWDVVRAFYNHAFPIPAQTLKRDTIKKLTEKDNFHIIKNAFLSAIFSKKVLKLKFKTELKTSIKKIYIVVENLSIRIGENPHRIYHIYSVKLSGKELQIEFEDVFYVFADGRSGDVFDFQRFLDDKLKEEYAIICISSDEKSWIFDYASSKEGYRFYPILYRERKIQVDMKKNNELGKDAYFIFEKNFQPFLKHIGYKKISEKNSEGFLLIGVKPPFNIPPKLKNEPYVNSVLSLFFIKNFKGETPEDEKVMIYALLSWLSFLSESYAYGFVKPKFMQKKLLDLNISRKIGKDNPTLRNLKLDSGALITELGFLVRRSLMGKFVDNTK